MSVHYITLQRQSHTAPKHRMISKPRCLPRGKPDIQHGAERQSSRGRYGICAFLMSQTRLYSVRNRVDNTFSCVPWCVLYSCVCVCARGNDAVNEARHQERARTHVCRSASISCLAWLHRYRLYSVISPLVWFAAENCKQLTNLLFPLSPHSANG